MTRLLNAAALEAAEFAAEVAVLREPLVAAAAAAEKRYVVAVVVVRIVLVVVAVEKRLRRC